MGTLIGAERGGGVPPSERTDGVIEWRLSPSGGGESTILGCTWLSVIDDEEEDGARTAEAYGKPCAARVHMVQVRVPRLELWRFQRRRCRLHAPQLRPQITQRKRDLDLKLDGRGLFKRGQLLRKLERAGVLRIDRRDGVV
jgi:hypothetical protein